MIADGQSTPDSDLMPRGGGDAYLCPTEENKLVALMLSPRRRWRLNEEAKDYAIQVTRQNMADDDARVSNGAVSNFIKMEGQNQADEHKLLGEKEQVHQHLHLHGTDDRNARLAQLAREVGVEPSAIGLTVDDADAALGGNGHTQNGHAGNGKAGPG